MLLGDVVVHMKCGPMVTSLNVVGVVVFITATVKGPHNQFAAEPETESNQIGVEDYPDARTEAVNAGCAAAVIVAVLQGF